MTIAKKSKKSKALKCILVIYLLVLVKVIVFKYPLSQLQNTVESWTSDVFWQGLTHANFTFFKTIRMYIVYWGRINSFENLVGNVVLFIPFGILHPLEHGKKASFSKTAFIALLFIVFLELVQLKTNFGAFDVDDILLNFIGMAIGYFFYFIAIKKRKKNV